MPIKTPYQKLKLLQQLLTIARGSNAEDIFTMFPVLETIQTDHECDFDGFIASNGYGRDHHKYEEIYFDIILYYKLHGTSFIEALCKAANLPPVKVTINGQEFKQSAAENCLMELNSKLTTERFQFVCEKFASLLQEPSDEYEVETDDFE